jgi:lysozyme
MSSIHALIKYEEGWREKPYRCTEGYPTIGYGFRIGPKNADMKLYQFTLPKAAGDIWLNVLLSETESDMYKRENIAAALDACSQFRARYAVLQSMAHQMGVDGLSGFKNTLKAIANRDWSSAAAGMLDSKWARQTPERAQRHAEQMRTGLWASVYGG